MLESCWKRDFSSLCQANMCLFTSLHSPHWCSMDLTLLLSKWLAQHSLIETEKFCRSSCHCRRFTNFLAFHLQAFKVTWQGPVHTYWRGLMGIYKEGDCLINVVTTYLGAVKWWRMLMYHLTFLASLFILSYKYILLHLFYMFLEVLIFNFLFAT